ncbi:Gfo/Idh/MocA family protein [Amphibacillus jilinensis]|uniref:Gfo/Idh/MocA family protein n=1 Tax=Amphibacillus jilinensis TaxID=1216008 RepID=UPI00030FAF2F|nr:Gfo/Idh/MocA family oxidoreductase [Amphibacillus jilinensis]
MKLAILSFAHMHAHSYAQAITRQQGAELLGIWDDDHSRGKEAANTYRTVFYENLDSLLKTNIDAVIICSENVNHKPLVVQAAEHKKHILCEKPISTEIDDAKVMIEACKINNVILQMAYPVRFIPAVEAAIEKVQAGEIGDIIAINASNHGQMPGSWFVEKEKSGGGAATDHIVHIMDVVRVMLQAEAEAVYAYLDTLFYPIDVEDAGQVMIEMGKGTILNIDPSWSRPRTFPTWGDVLMEIVGTKGTISVDGFKDATIYYNDTDCQVSHLPWGIDMDEALIRDFIDCLKTKREPTISGEDGLRTLEVVKSAYQSNYENAFVKVLKEEV